MVSSEVVLAADARRNLPKYLKSFRRSPRTSSPIVFGPHRKPEAVLLSVAQYQELLDRIEEMTARAELAEALLQDTGKRRDLAGLVREHGFDPVEFGLD